MTNLVEILKDATIGTELYSPVYGVIKLKSIVLDDSTYPIVCNTDIGDVSFTSTGKYYGCKNGECVLFPSEAHRTWNDWQQILLKKGDFVVNMRYSTTHIVIDNNPLRVLDNCADWRTQISPSSFRYATKSEKEAFLRELQENGYSWEDNKVVKLKSEPPTETTLSEKFDIKLLQPFDKVLVRDNDNQVWRIDFFEYRVKDSYRRFSCLATLYNQCIPYNRNTKHLLGTKNDCPNSYKTW